MTLNTPNFENVVVISKAIESNATCLNEMLNELENFDSLIESPIWGQIQSQILELSESYRSALKIIEASLRTDNNEKVNDLLASFSEQLRPIIIDAMNAGGRDMLLSVSVAPTIH